MHENSQAAESHSLEPGANSKKYGEAKESPTSIKQACEWVCRVLRSDTEELPTFVSQEAGDAILSLDAQDRTLLADGFSSELYLILPNAWHWANVEGVGFVRLSETRTTRASAPNFVARWYVGPSEVTLVELEVENTAWPEGLPPLLRFEETR